MLNIFFGDMENVIFNTSVFFDNTYQDSRFQDDFTKRVIKDIDKGEILGPNCVTTKILGPIPPTKIAGGTKTILLMKFDNDHIFNASTCGDNCAKWILKIAKDKDLTINLRHIMNFGKKDFTAKILNSGKIITTQKEYVEQAVMYL